MHTWYDIGDRIGQPSPKAYRRSIRDTYIIIIITTQLRHRLQLDYLPVEIGFEKACDVLQQVGLQLLPKIFRSYGGSWRLRDEGTPGSRMLAQQESLRS